jgi:hypothetical protein
MRPDGGRQDIGNPPTNVEAVKDINVPEELQILEDKAVFWLSGENEETRLFA